MARQGSRAFRPSMDDRPLESRELLSSIIALMAAGAPKAVSAFTALKNRVVASQVVYSGNTGAVGNGNRLSNNQTTNLLGNGSPTPREVARETFRAGFVGRYYTGPGRFSDQSTTYYFRGLGGSNFFLHGDFNMAVVTPADPSKPFLGEAVLNDKSTNSSGIVGFILRGSRTSVDSQGRPTRLTLVADSNIYSGIFFDDAAEGTVDITYGANHSAKVTFNGLVYTNGLTNPLVNSNLHVRSGHPGRFVGKPRR